MIEYESVGWFFLVSDFSNSASEVRNGILFCERGWRCVYIIDAGELSRFQQKHHSGNVFGAEASREPDSRVPERGSLRDTKRRSSIA